VGLFLSALAYGLTFLLHLAALLIALEWALRALPAAGLNPLRRFLFKALFPLLKLGQALGMNREGFDLTPGFLMVTILLFSRWILPWMALAGYHLRG